MNTMTTTRLLWTLSEMCLMYTYNSTLTTIQHSPNTLKRTGANDAAAFFILHALCVVVVVAMQSQTHIHTHTQRRSRKHSQQIAFMLQNENKRQMRIQTFSSILTELTDWRVCAFPKRMRSLVLFSFLFYSRPFVFVVGVCECVRMYEWNDVVAASLACTKSTMLFAFFVGILSLSISHILISSWNRVRNCCFAFSIRFSSSSSLLLLLLPSHSPSPLLCFNYRCCCCCLPACCRISSSSISLRMCDSKRSSFWMLLGSLLNRLFFFLFVVCAYVSVLTRNHQAIAHKTFENGVAALNSIDTIFIFICIK